MDRAKSTIPGLRRNSVAVTLPSASTSSLAKLRKGDDRKALIAHILMEQTSVRQRWIVETLHMGSAPYVSRLAKLMGERIARGDRAMGKLKKEIAKILS